MKIVIGIIAFGIISIPFLWIYLLISNIVYNVKKYNRKKREEQRQEEIKLEEIDREFYEGILENIHELMSLGIELDDDATADYEEAIKWLSEHPKKRR